MSQTMDVACEFGMDYLPTNGSPDTVAIEHVKNCPDCQDQVVVVDGFDH